MQNKIKTYSIKHFFVNVSYVFRILFRKPLFFLRLANNYLQIFIHPLRTPLRFVDIALTYKCNMRCAHCSATDMARNDARELTVGDYKEVAARLIRAGALVVNFTGGEPFLRKDLKHIIKAFQPNKVLIAIQSNALILDEKLLRDLREQGVDSINLSLDGATPVSHDGFRNSPGAFNKVIATIKLAKKIGFNVGLSYCLTHDNLYSEDHKNVVAISKEFNTFLNYNLAVPVGFWRGQYDNLITEEDREYLNKLLEEYPRSKTDFETNYFKKGCGAIKEKIYVTAYGDVMPCPFIQVSFGNLLADDVETIRTRAFQYEYFRDYWPKCLAAEDMDFIANVRCYDVSAKDLKMPISYKDAFLNKDSVVGDPNK